MQGSDFLIGQVQEMKGELSYALSIAHIEILYCSTMKHILEIILAFLTGLYCCHCAGAVAAAARRCGVGRLAARRRPAVAQPLRQATWLAPLRQEWPWGWSTPL